jgi:hypothetical protein
MKLPDCHNVHIEDAKVRGYLLSTTHPVGRFKARIFAALGFTEARATLFVAEIRRIAAAGEVETVEDSEYGRKYTVPGLLEGPKGQARVRTVWFQAPGQSQVRLVSVRPR